MCGSGPTVVVFDTDCVLCSAWIQFLLRHERDDALRFASSRDATGLCIAARHGLGPQEMDLTYLVVEGGKALTKTDASLALTAHLKAPWRYLGALRIIPRGLRDAVYDLVARNRLRWFGQRRACFVPSPEQRSRFLDQPPYHGQTVPGPQ